MVECEMPLVLVHNDVVANPAHAWNDVEGVHYHYPSKYQGKIKTGEPFVYYRGVHRTEGKRGAAEYVGTGRNRGHMGRPRAEQRRAKGVVLRHRRLSIGFRGAGPCEDPRGVTFGSRIPAANLWRDGVRTIDPRGLQSNTNPLRRNTAGREAAFRRMRRISKPPDNLIVPPTVAAPGAGRRVSTGYRKIETSEGNRRLGRGHRSPIPVSTYPKLHQLRSPRRSRRDSGLGHRLSSTRTADCTGWK